MRDFKLFLIVVLICLSVLYLLKTDTYTSYESTVDTSTNIPIATWQIFVNNQSIHTNKSLKISDITWYNTQSSLNKVAPGSRGQANLSLKSESDVAVKYDITYVDKTKDNNKVLTLTDIEGSTKVGEKYSGIINVGETKQITLNLSWINDENNNDIDSLIGQGLEPEYIDLNIEFTQYNGS